MIKLSYLILALTLVATVNAVAYQTSYTLPQAHDYANADLQVATLKYDPYPVNPGSWYDIWVQVENTGESDATQVTFNLSSDYPFTPSDTERTFTTVSGTARAHDLKLPDENSTEANIVLLKYHVFVSQNASEGTYNLHLHAQYTPGDNQKVVDENFDLPVSVEKTKTDFTVTMQHSTAQETTFTISNTGEKDANAVTVSVAPEEVNLLNGQSVAVIGTLATGDFTTVDFPVTPNTTVKTIDLDVSYTDTSGTRTTIRKTVPVSLGSEEISTQATAAPIGPQWLSGLVGMIIGIVLALILSHISKRAE